MRLKFLFLAVMAVGLSTQNVDAQVPGAPRHQQNPHPSKVYGYISLFDGQQRPDDQWHMTRNEEAEQHGDLRFAYFPRLKAVKVYFNAINGSGVHVVTLDGPDFERTLLPIQSQGRHRALKYEIYFALDVNAPQPRSMGVRSAEETLRDHRHPLFQRVDVAAYGSGRPMVFIKYSPETWVFDRVELEPLQIPTMIRSNQFGNTIVDETANTPVPLQPRQRAFQEYPDDQR